MNMASLFLGLDAVKNLVISMRPRQWIKNLLLFAALIFSKNVLHPQMALTSLKAFALFCMLSSGVYLLNDLMDIEKDRNHPRKALRPLPSGRLSPSLAKIACLALLASSLFGSLFINHPFAGISLGYLALQIAYSKWFKERVILDVFSIGAGFFLRVVVGAKAIGVPISSWLLLCTLFLSLFLALGKRRHELIWLGEEATTHRGVLREYNVSLLDQMVGVATAGTVISYALYTLSSETIQKFQTENLGYTIPIVLYGIFRYLYLVYQKGEGGHPELLFFDDKSLLAAVLLYGIVVGIVLYF
jgi:4-hydroxybenzoate polyprenyltransferase